MTERDKLVYRPRLLGHRTYVQGVEVLAHALRHVGHGSEEPAVIARLKIGKEIHGPYSFRLRKDHDDAAGLSDWRGEIDVELRGTRLKFDILEQAGELEREMEEIYLMDQTGGTASRDGRWTCILPSGMTARLALKEAIELVKRMHQHAFDSATAKRRYLASAFESVRCDTPWQRIVGLTATITRQSLVGAEIYTFAKIVFSCANGENVGSFRTQFVGLANRT